MRPKTYNAIILTSGLTGSSVLTSLLVRAGYWPGTRTYKKKDYDTFENQSLIDLNQDILSDSGYKGDFTTEFSRPGIDLIAESLLHDDKTRYQQFISICDGHQPWVWKDPRLWLTIRFWNHLIDFKSTRLIVLTRNPWQLWISTILRRQIQSFKYCKAYQENIRSSVIYFAEEEGLPILELVFEDLICEPGKAIDKLNAYLGTRLTTEDLTEIYANNLYTKAHGRIDFLKAALIYLRNYRSRRKHKTNRKH